jgi:Tfp pilus assembly protein FimV
VKLQGSWVALVITLSMSLGCEEERVSRVEEPEPVAPVEVSPNEADELRARVAELEQQLAQAQGEAAPPATEQAEVPEAPEAVMPEGVLPEEAAPAATAEAARTTPTPTKAPSTTRASSATRAEPGLLETLLGPDDPATRRRRPSKNDDTLQLPNPARVLLGN